MESRDSYQFSGFRFFQINGILKRPSRTETRESVSVLSKKGGIILLSSNYVGSQLHFQARDQLLHLLVGFSAQEARWEHLLEKKRVMHIRKHVFFSWFPKLFIVCILYI